MIVNAAQRDGTDGTAASASSESYRARRQGNLVRSSDGFRSPTLANDPRRKPEGGHTPDPPSAPYKYQPRPPESNDKRNTPRTWAFFRPASLGAPRVNFPDAQRCEGHYQRSGESWGHFGEPQRAVLTPARDGQNAPPSHTLGQNRPGSASAMGPRWTPPSSPTVYEHLPH